jgi:(p)ppGpp synthase/HD superfamily hydrolase
MVDLIKKAKIYANKCHNDIGQMYGKHPYTYHTDGVADLFEKHSGVFVHKEDIIHTHASCHCHDLIEDAQQTFNNVRDNTNIEVARIVLAVTDIHEENRLLRHLATLPKTAKDHRAIILKLCDLGFNANFSKKTGSTMFKKYHEEYVYKRYVFKKAIPWHIEFYDMVELNKLWDVVDAAHSLKN